ncbi:hypothetical protein OC844_006377 [Tilletia horrida]|nr:hypothetical protein OC844_006377 [Tilletia horrida]
MAYSRAEAHARSHAHIRSLSREEYVSPDARGYAVAGQQSAQQGATRSALTSSSFASSNGDAARASDSSIIGGIATSDDTREGDYPDSAADSILTSTYSALPDSFSATSEHPAVAERAYSLPPPEASGSAQKQDYSPFPDKVTFVVHMISNAPRRPMSVNQIKSVLLALRLLGVQDVPSYSSYKQAVQRVREHHSASALKPFKGLHGHEFFINSIGHGLQSDFGNPLLRTRMQLYPRQGDSISSYMDSVNAGADERTRPPMADIGNGRHAFVNEVVELEASWLFVTAWFQGNDGKIWAQGFPCEQHPFHYTVSGSATTVPASLITYTAYELAQRTSAQHVWLDGKKKPMLHPLRHKAQGRPVYNVPIFVFLDDVSGAASKRWNKHHVCLTQCATYEASALNLDATLRLFTMSHDATPQEICQALVAEFKIKGTTPVESVRKRFVDMTKTGTARTVASLKKSLEDQLDKASSGHRTSWSVAATKTGVKDKLTTSACQQLVAQFSFDDADDAGLIDDDAAEAEFSAAPISDEDKQRVGAMKAEIIAEGKHWNPLFELYELTGFDVTKDLPCDILHTLLLGTVKYLTRATTAMLKASEKEQLAKWLSMANIEGIGDGKQLRGEYLMRHSQSLVGKDFKKLSQVMHWALSQLGADPHLCQAWYAQGILSAALHAPVVERAQWSQWKQHVHKALHNFYLSFARIKPDQMAEKPKLHVLAHALHDLERFGPLPVISAERFESFNAVVRQASMLSNRLTPSRDIAQRLADQSIARQVLSNAWLSDDSIKSLRKPGSALTFTLRSSEVAHKAMARLYGLESNKSTRAGNSKRGPAEICLRSGDWAQEGNFVTLRSSLKKQAQSERGGEGSASTQETTLAKILQIRTQSNKTGNDPEPSSVVVLPLWAQQSSSSPIVCPVVREGDLIDSRELNSTVSPEA